MGCGWLGLPLAKFLITDGFQVQGSTTSKEKIKTLENQHINPFLISLSENDISGNMEGFLSKTNTLIINVPPRLRGDQKENYVKKMKRLHAAIHRSGIKRIIFISSTSVYGDIDGIVTEETNPEPATESGKQLLLSENIFRNDTSLETTIVRFGGLIGADRHPITMLSGRSNLSNGNFPINLIHLEDCIKIISEILKNGWWNEIFNGVYPYHPTKQQYYTSKAIENKFQIPEYELVNDKIGKTVASNRLINIKDFKFTRML